MGLFGLDAGGFLVWLRGEPGLPWPLDGASGTVTGVGLSMAALGLWCLELRAAAALVGIFCTELELGWCQGALGNQGDGRWPVTCHCSWRELQAVAQHGVAAGRVVYSHRDGHRETAVPGSAAVPGSHPSVLLSQTCDE